MVPLVDVTLINFLVVVLLAPLFLQDSKLCKGDFVQKQEFAVLRSCFSEVLQELIAGTNILRLVILGKILLLPYFFAFNLIL